MITTGTSVLDKILEGQVKGKPNGIGFDYEPLHQKQRNMNFAYALEDHGLIRKQKQNKYIKFVGVAGTNVVSISKPMLKHFEEHQNSKNKKKSPWICHHCGRYGHIRPYCYKLYPPTHVQPKVSGKSVQARKEWKPKNPKVSSSVTSSVSINVPPVLTKSENLVQSSLNVADVIIQLIKVFLCLLLKLLLHRMLRRMLQHPWYNLIK
jgi:hypothetical protein